MIILDWCDVHDGPYQVPEHISYKEACSPDFEHICPVCREGGGFRLRALQAARRIVAVHIDDTMPVSGYPEFGGPNPPIDNPPFDFPER